MRKSQLSQWDIEIGNRLKWTREEFLGISQMACSSALEIKRSTLANYEAGRTPLRVDLALKFCRQFVISEEWFATGRCVALRAALESRGQPVAQADGALWDEVFGMRHCLDLWSDSTTRHIKPALEFSTAYAETLGNRYRELVFRNVTTPIVSLSQADSPNIAQNYLTFLNERNFQVLEIEAGRKGLKASDFWRVYTLCMIEAGSLFSARLRGKPCSPPQFARLGWLRAIANDPTLALPPLVDEVWSPRAAPPPLLARQSDGAVENPSDFSLQNGNKYITNRDVPATLQALISRLNTIAEQRGKKAQLAGFMGVAHPTVSGWLSGKHEPSGDATLRLLEWVLAEEAKQTKSPDHVVARSERQTQKGLSYETKLKPSPEEP